MTPWPLLATLKRNILFWNESFRSIHLFREKFFHIKDLANFLNSPPGILSSLPLFWCRQFDILQIPEFWVNCKFNLIGVKETIVAWSAQKIFALEQKKKQFTSAVGVLACLLVDWFLCHTNLHDFFCYTFRLESLWSAPQEISSQIISKPGSD